MTDFITRLLRSPEGKTLEFKRDLSSPRPLLKTLVAFANRIEVESPGLLLPGLTVEEMKQGVSQIRNPVIARVFPELNLIEQWGSGIPGIFREAKANKLPEPTIEEIAGRVRFSVALAEPLRLSPEQSRKTRELDIEKLEDWIKRYSLSELWEKNVLGGQP